MASRIHFAYFDRARGKLDPIHKNLSAAIGGAMRMANIDDLERLVRLRDSGVLTEAEFTSQKQALLETSNNTRGNAASTPMSPAPKRSPFLGEPGFLAGLILSASCAGSAAIAAHDPSFANFRASAIALCLFTAALALFLGWLSGRRWLVPSALLGLWGIAQIYFAASPSLGLSTPGWLHRLAMLPTVFALLLTWDALRSAWATNRARRGGEAAPAPIDRWGIGLWLSRNPVALVLMFIALIASYFSIDLIAGHSSGHTRPSAPSVAITAPTYAAKAGPGAAPSSNPTGTVDPGALGWPAADSAVSTASPEANLAAFRQQELHPAQNADRPTNWDEIVEQQEHQRALFYDVARRAPELITSQDITWVRRDAAGSIQGNCDNRDTDMRVALHPALTDAFCDAQPPH